MNATRAITAAIERANAAGHPALVAFMTAGYPTRERFRSDLASIAAEADIVEVGVPFTDPLADGVTIQRSSHAALAAGVNLAWILDEIARDAATRKTPVLLMGYLNPLLSFGYEKLAQRAAAAGVNGFIVPDLPWEESAPLRAALAPHALALVQLVTPVTPAERLAKLCSESGGFVYAVTVTGVTGGAGEDQSEADSVAAYLDRVRAASPVPVCAGFGIRSAAQVAALSAHTDGVVVGSALVEALEKGFDAAAFLRSLRMSA